MRIWWLSYRRGQISELEHELIRIAFHIAGEMNAVLALLAGGWRLARGASRGQPLLSVALGMLFYTAIERPGYFAQRGQPGWTAMFGTILVLGVMSLCLLKK